MDSNLLKCLYTIVAKSDGFVFRPWIKGRDKESELVWKGVEKLFDIQIEKQAQLLKQDETNTNIDIKYLKQIATQGSNNIYQEDGSKKEPYLECYNNIRNNLTENIVHREFRKEVNFAKTISIAADILSQDQSELPTEQVEQDWIDRFREAASNTTTEEIQQLWGRILAGEIKSPGKHSLRTLEFIKNLSTKEAQQIERLFSFVIMNKYIVRGFKSFYDCERDVLDSRLSDYLLDMQSLGVLSGADTSLRFNVPPKFVKEINYYPVWFRKLDGKLDGFNFTHDNRNQELRLPICTLTHIGKELHNLCYVEMDNDYLYYICKLLEEQGFKKVPQNKIKLDFE